MNNTEAEGRPRPLSAGLWTLFSWLRRDDRSVSSDSLSSAGSDRTVASFAYLPPAHYQTAKAPLVVPPPGPPTDSYKKRVQDRNIRRHHDRDITLHRKYGLLKIDGYDAFSLPSARRSNSEASSRWDRDRRATSECYQRRLAHVPGKRRAPLPPVPGAGHSASLTRRYSRKRPAPQPPVRLMEKNKDSLRNDEVNNTSPRMSSNSCHDRSKTRSNVVTVDCKPEKCSKKDASNKDAKIKSEKSFLKQIFDGKKRNSNIDTSTVKVLPSISELDKQAAEFIEACKLKEIPGQKNDGKETWFCIYCLRKYSSSVTTCAICVPKQTNHSTEINKDNKEVRANGSNSYTQTEKYLGNRNYDCEDKQKLKEMLKEMKDSLPKRPKHDFDGKTEHQSVEVNKKNIKNNTEAPTLRVGSSVKHDIKKTHLNTQAPSSNIDTSKSISKPINSPQKQFPPSLQTALVAQVISAYKKDIDNNLNRAVKMNINQNSAQIKDADIQVKKISLPQDQTADAHKNTNISDTPLRISSLLNPMYVPKNLISEKLQSSNGVQTELKMENPKACKTKKETSQPKTVSSDILLVPSTSKAIVNHVNMENKPQVDVEMCSRQLMSMQEDKSPKILSEAALESNKPKVISKLPIPAKEQNYMNDMKTQDEHSRRRDLINQLEKAISQGDERVAAEAAAKLAQLRLSCSVLSFTSQILFQPSSIATNNVNVQISKSEVNTDKPTTKKESDNKVHIKPHAAKLNALKERSPPNVPVSKASPSISQVASSTTIALQNVGDEVKQQKVQVHATQNENNNNLVTIAVLVEDREATRGPVHLRISRQACIRDLRREAETSLGLANNLQRWIVGRVLCVNDDTPIVSLAGPDFSAPFYLCVVDSETKNESVSPKNNITASKDTKDLQVKSGNVYTELVQLEQQALVPNAEIFECTVCMVEYPPGLGVVLRECVHIFCKECLSDMVRHCEEPNVPCPAMGCRGSLQEREIRALVLPQEYERWLARGLAAAESGTRNAFHCRTRDCKGWALCEPGVLRFPCPVCKCINCVPCQAIHDGHTCEQYRAKLKQAASNSTNVSETDDGTRTLLNSLISKGEALECPECSAIITKKWGCDWVKCSACKTEICWVTRGRRWGPGGKGDTSGGCRCGVDGKRCHPSCGYCH